MQPKRQAPRTSARVPFTRSMSSFTPFSARLTMLVSQLLKIGRGAIIELEQKTTDPVELQVNQKLVAYGEIVTVDDKLGVTITDVVKKPFG